MGASVLCGSPRALQRAGGRGVVTGAGIGSAEPAYSVLRPETWSVLDLVLNNALAMKMRSELLVGRGECCL